MDYAYLELQKFESFFEKKLKKKAILDCVWKILRAKKKINYKGINIGEDGNIYKIPSEINYIFQALYPNSSLIENYSQPSINPQEYSAVEWKSDKNIYNQIKEKVLLLKSKSLFNNQRYSLSLKNLNSLIKFNPSNSIKGEVFFYRALCNYQLKKHSSSYNDFLSANKYNYNYNDYLLDSEGIKFDDFTTFKKMLSNLKTLYGNRKKPKTTKTKKKVSTELAKSIEPKKTTNKKLERFLKLKLGQLYEGGVIFSLDKTNYSIGIISNITSSKLMSWPEAKRFVDNMELNGYDDWEMPTQNELKKVKNNINLINQSFNNNFSYSRNLQNID